MENNIDIELREEAGLLCCGKDEDGDLEWLGTAKEWDIYSTLLQQYEQ